MSAAIVSSGEVFTIGIETEEARDVVERYLHQFSNDVRYCKTSERKHRKEKGKRKTPVGVICSCVHRLDKINTFSLMRLKGFDIRHAM